MIVWVLLGLGASSGVGGVAGAVMLRRHFALRGLPPEKKLLRLRIERDWNSDILGRWDVYDVDASGRLASGLFRWTTIRAARRHKRKRLLREVAQAKKGEEIKTVRLTR